jgi:hypothetical protein
MSHPNRIRAGPAKFDPEIAAFRPPQLRERTPERREPKLHIRIALLKAEQHADPPNWTGLLRTRRERPSGGRTAEKHDEIAPLHGRPQVQ